MVKESHKYNCCHTEISFVRSSITKKSGVSLKQSSGGTLTQKRDCYIAISDFFASEGLVFVSI